MGVKLCENTVVELKVLRISDVGAFLDGQTGNTNDDILLHKNQQIHPVQQGDTVRVFLYHDPSGRLTASMRLPKIKIGQIGYAPVINTTRFGAFVDVGTERGIFMPFAEMKGRPKDAKIGDWVEGAVYNITENGAYLMTRERWIAFLHRSEWTTPVLIGQMIKGRIAFIRDDGRINISLRKVKEAAMDEDSEKIMSLLDARNGKMPYGDKTDPLVIKSKFGLSKAAFKRALGRLMKEGRVRQDDGWTYVVSHDE